MNVNLSSIRSTLIELYGENAGQEAFQRLTNNLDAHRGRIVSPTHATSLAESDIFLITYGDQVREPQVPPLETLAEFCKQHLAGLINNIHLLPFFPFSSDDGFSVTDYRAVNPDLGTWSDIHELGAGFRLMFDAVINHVSIHSEWFQGFLRDDPAYQDYFIVVEGEPDLSQVVRPRALPLLTLFETPSRPKRLWTTFSEDQVDLNYKNPTILLDIVNLLLFYAAQGATFLRLDAIAYLWKEIGTTCIHLPQTHRIIQLIRAVLDEAAPHVMLISEANVRHDEYISYFGDGKNEAQLVYNFALPPLTLYTFFTGDSRTLSHWAKTLTLPSDKTAFFNFLASHDGIGLNPARGFLSEDEIDLLVRKTVEHGGLVSYKQNVDGTQSPYELNINYFDALSNPNGGESLDRQVNRFMAAQAIMLSLVGVPGIYFHSMFGSRGWMEGVIQTGHKRAINREKCQRVAIDSELADNNFLRSKVFRRYRQLLEARRSTSAFHPSGTQHVLEVHPSLFTIERISPDETSYVLCWHNISDNKITVEVEWEQKTATDLFTGQPVQGSNLTLEPYQYLWVNL